MTDKELRRLRRDDLLQILIAQQRQIDELTASMEAAQAQLQQRKIAMEQSGSVAEAALRLNGVFDAAQAAADQYMAEMRARADELRAGAEAESEKARRASQELLDAARSQADGILREARSEGERLKAEGEKILQEARVRTGAEPPTMESIRGAAEEEVKQKRGFLRRK